MVDQGDIIDETLDLFRANSLFRNFEIKGPGDRLLIILVLFISDCLAKLGSARIPPTQIEASKTLNTLAVDNFPIPGDANFLLNAHYAPPASRADAGEFFSALYVVHMKKVFLPFQTTFANIWCKFARNLLLGSSRNCTRMERANQASGGCLSRKDAS
jgi:hypothetical protein